MGKGPGWARGQNMGYISGFAGGDMRLDALLRGRENTADSSLFRPLQQIRQVLFP
jgi:hypothetical protein